MKTDVCDKDTAIADSGRSRAASRAGSAAQNTDKAEMMKKMEAAGAPGPAHMALDAFAGTWNAEVKCWGEPGGEAQVSKGTAKALWKFKGRFLEEDFHGEMMGTPFSGRTLLGYDNAKKVFNSLWISDTQTSMFFSEGKGDSGNKVITLEGESTCPINGRRDMKTVLRMLGQNKHTLEMFDITDGKNAKVMEITYTRA